MAAQPPDLRRVVEKFVQALEDEIVVEEVILFGSHARGDATADSDIDLAVISSAFGENTLHDLQFLARKKRAADLRIEAFAYHPWALKAATPGSFLAEILRTGRRVYRKEQAKGQSAHWDRSKQV